MADDRLERIEEVVREAADAAFSNELEWIEDGNQSRLSFQDFARRILEIANRRERVERREGERRVPLDGEWNGLRWPVIGCEPVSAKDERRTADRRKAE